MQRFSDLIVRSLPENKITGTASVYYDGTPGTQYLLYDDTYERIAPGAWDEVLRSNPQVYCYLNHDKNNCLGSTPDTLTVWADKIGLQYIDQLDPEIVEHRSAQRKIERGDVKGSSFGARIAATGGVKWSKEGGKMIRTILRFDALWDVSPVYHPAYSGTGIMLRSADIDDLKRECELSLDTQMRIERSKNLK